MKITKVVMAFLATILVLAGAFVYPIFFNWYTVNYLKEINGFLPEIMSMYLWICLLIVIVMMWVRILNEK